MTTRDYGDIYGIKDFMIGEIAPKYFGDDVNNYNVGLLGYTTEVGAVTTEDVFNAMNTYMKEFFSTKANMPETLYTYASIYDVDDFLATPASVDGILFIKASDIKTFGTPTTDRYVFTFDSNTIIYVNGIPFMLDYDIKVTYRTYRGADIYKSQYDLTFNNSLSNVNSPYLKTYTIKQNNEDYVAIVTKFRQVKRFTFNENVLSNDRINYVSLRETFDGQLAGIDVFYKEPGSTHYIKLRKIMYGSTPVTEPFFFYKIIDDENVEISFTSRDRYFKPEFNSDLKIVIYTTDGEGGNFREYTGTDIAVAGASEVYDYMSRVVMFALVNGESKYGQNKKTLEELRVKIVEKQSTIGTYNTESDLQLFFTNIQTEQRFINFIKKRDDLVDRLFTGFILLKNRIGDYFHTNTLNGKIYNGMYDYIQMSTGRSVIKPGRVWKYVDGTNDMVELCKDCSAINPLNDSEQFLFTNPFMISYQSNPSIVGFYLNTIDDNLTLDFKESNEDSYIQFIANQMTVKRNAIAGENSYKVQVTIRPTIDILEDQDGVVKDLEKLKVYLSFEDYGNDTKALPMTLKSYDIQNQHFTYECELVTNDNVNSNEKVTFFDLFDLDKAVVEEGYVPMCDAIVNINIFFKLDTPGKMGKFDKVPELAGHTLVNRYGTDTNLANFIIPINYIRSRTKYYPFVDKDDEGNPVNSYYNTFTQIPLLGIEHAKNNSDISEFVREMKYTYEYFANMDQKKTSNYNIDLKLYNTYGKSKNFVLEDGSDKLDRTNISIKFGVAPTIGALNDELLNEVREYIKGYIENINKNKSQNIDVIGYNAIYISNLIQELENGISTIKFLKFRGINDYDPMIQVIENTTVDPKLMTTDERRDYVPEYLTIRLEDIKLDII